ncbi:MAG TPA: hypothetical protein VML50_18500 [Anaeromyxobacter sp.]|nr:hypothetical protein [Anaeromyxobacter sp.]
MNDSGPRGVVLPFPGPRRPGAHPDLAFFGLGLVVLAAILALAIASGAAASPAPEPPPFVYGG